MYRNADGSNWQSGRRFAWVACCVVLPTEGLPDLSNGRLPTWQFQSPLVPSSQWHGGALSLCYSLSLESQRTYCQCASNNSLFLLEDSPAKIVMLPTRCRHLTSCHTFLQSLLVCPQGSHIRLQLFIFSLQPCALHREVGYSSLRACRVSALNSRTGTASGGHLPSH